MPRIVDPWVWRRLVRDHAPRKRGFLLTLYVIGTYMNRDGEAWPSQTTIAQRACCTPRSVKNHVRKARQLGWLETRETREGGQGWRRYTYRATAPDDIELPARDDKLADELERRVGEGGEALGELSGQESRTTFGSVPSNVGKKTPDVGKETDGRGEKSGRNVGKELRPMKLTEKGVMKDSSEGRCARAQRRISPTLIATVRLEIEHGEAPETICERWEITQADFEAIADEARR